MWLSQLRPSSSGPKAIAVITPEIRRALAIRVRLIKRWLFGLDVYRLAASVFKAAVRDRILGISPRVDVRLSAKPQREVVLVTPEQVAALADTIPHCYRTLVIVGAGCGLRLGEAT